MLGQIVCANGVLAPQGQKVGNIVLMGSGEPLDNYDNVCRFLRLLREEDGAPFVLEINTIPGMSAGSIVPKQVRAAGMTLGELYDLIIADTCGRKP